MKLRRSKCLRRFALLAATLLLLTGCRAATMPEATAQPVDIGMAAPQSTAGSTAQAAPQTTAGSTAQAAPNGMLRVLFINVGRADATLVQYEGKNYLIDTGLEESLPRLLSALALSGVTRLDGLFLTHTHSDHIGGMRGVSRYLEVDACYRANFSEQKKNGGNKIDERAAELGLPLTILFFGDTVPIDDGVAFEVIGPVQMDEQEDNENSLVLRLVVNGRTLLFTGDLQFAGEASLLARDIPLRCDVLKVGNHGNPDATSNAFAAAASPSLAFISTDTKEDANSANPRVFSALAPAEVYVTEDYDVGALLQIAPDGAMEVDALPRPAPAAGSLVVTGFDRDAQSVTIQNDGAEADLSGYILYSTRGSEVFRFPDGARLAAGGMLSVYASTGAGAYTFIGEDKVWHATKDDTAVLFDAAGNELSRFAG